MNLKIFKFNLKLNLHCSLKPEMNNSEQTPYNRHGLKLYCKSTTQDPNPKPDSRKNIVKSAFNNSSK
jgi:hypothetical protein